MGDDSANAYAQSLGLSPSLLYGWKAKECGPTLREIQKFVDVARVSVLWLCFGLGSKSDFTSLDGRHRERIEAAIPKEESLSSLARRAELSRPTVVSLLRRNASPTLETIFALSRALDLSVRWVLTGQAPKRPFEGLPESKADDASATRAPSTDPVSTSDNSDAARIAAFRSLLDVALERGDAHTLAWLRVELDVLTNRLDERWPDLIRRAPTDRNGVA